MLDLNPFCATYKGRHDLMKPFVRAGVRYATDYHILVAVPAPGEPDTDGVFPKMDGIIVRPDAALLLPWPATEIPRPMEVQCRLCEGQTICPTCEQRCPDCHGTGKVLDEEGAAELDPETRVAGKHIRLIAALPGVKWHQPRPESTIYFCFDGGEGAVRPRVGGKH